MQTSTDRKGVFGMILVVNDTNAFNYPNGSRLQPIAMGKNAYQRLSDTQFLSLYINFIHIQLFL